MEAHEIRSQRGVQRCRQGAANKATEMETYRLYCCCWDVTLLRCFIIRFVFPQASGSSGGFPAEGRLFVQPLLGRGLPAKGMAMVAARESGGEFMSLVLDARKPISTFAKLMVARHEGESVRGLRRKAEQELYELPTADTPYGTVATVTTVVGTDGQFVWHHINIFAFFYQLALESKDFFELVKFSASGCPNNTLRLALYTDEVVPRNKLRPDVGGKYQAVYFQVVDFPDFIRSRLQLRWFTFGYASCADLREAGAEVSDLVAAVLKSWFGDPWDLQKTGVRVRNGTDVAHLYCSYECSPQDERAQKFCFDLKGASGRNPCASCDNCMGRVPFFEDGSGFVHVLSPSVHKFKARTVETANAIIEALASCAAHGSQHDLEELEMSVGIGYNARGLLFNAELRSHLAFPNCVYWDWMHNWCSSGGIGQYHVNEFVKVLATTLDMEMSDFDVFAKKVQFPRSTPRLTRSWFADRIQLGHGTHLRGFAAEVLTAVNVLAMFVQLVVKPAGILNEHVQCFEAMQRVFAIFKKGSRDDIPLARQANLEHHTLYMQLYSHCGKPKLHYCSHVIDCWQRVGKLLSCFGAESNHRFSADVFSFSYKKPCKTALAFDIRRLFAAARDPTTFQMYVLAGSAVAWGDDAGVDFGEPWGRAYVIASSTEIVTTVGRFFRNDLVEWHDKQIGFCKAFFHMRMAGNYTIHAAVIEQLTHSMAGLWTRSGIAIVNAALLECALPYVEEAGYVRPVYVPM